MRASDPSGTAAVALLHHAWFTGLILMVASREGEAVVGEWVRRTFQRQHEAKFLSSFTKLGLDGLPHAVACARYHYLSNRIGGVEVEYAAESDRKAWVRFPHPRWLYDGTALCGVPESVSLGFLRGWYARNGISLCNPRLGFVCTSQDMTAQHGFSGYFIEEDRELAADARLRFRPEEEPPPFVPERAPALPAVWTAERLAKANRNYAMDYVANGLAELEAGYGAAGMAHAVLSARLIGRQYHRRLEDTLACRGDGLAAFGQFLVAMAAGQDETADVVCDGDRLVVEWHRGRALGAIALASDATFAAWSGLWEGCLATHDRFFVLQAERTSAGVRLVIRRSPRRTPPASPGP
jgi:hypothetical protein